MQMCDRCQALTTADKDAAPHPDLVAESARSVGSILGSADERYFKCRACGHRWLHESGNLGFGWVP